MSQDKAPNTSPMSERQEKYYLTDLVIENHGPYAVLFLAGLDVQVFSTESADGEPLAFESISSGKWKYHGWVEIVKQVTFTIGKAMEGPEIFLFLHLLRAELEESQLSASLKSRIEQNFDSTTENCPMLKLSFEVSTENPKKAYEIDDSDVDSFEEIEEDEAYEERFSKSLQILNCSTENRRSLHDMGDHLMALYRKTGKRKAIHNCIESYRFATGLTSTNHPELASFAYDTGMAYLIRGQRIKNMRDFQGSIKYFEMSLDSIGGDDNLKAALLKSLGIVHFYIFQQTNDITSVFKASSYFEASLPLISDGDRSHLSILDALGELFSYSYKRTGDLDDISKAISYFQMAVKVSPEGHPNMSDRLNNLSGALAERYEHTQDPNDARESNVCRQKTNNNAPDIYGKNPYLLFRRGSASIHRFHNAGDFAALSEAISYFQKAIHLTPKGHKLLPTLLNNLGFYLTTHFNLYGNCSDIIAAVDHLNRAVHLTRNGHSLLPMTLHNLGFALLRNFESPASGHDRSHSIYRTSLSEAIAVLQEALDLSSDDDRTMRMSLNSLGVSLLRRFELDGDMNDLNKAIILQRKAVDLSPVGDVDITHRLTNLGLSLKQRFTSTNNVIDISEAISVQQRAVDLCSEYHRNGALLRNNLGDSLAARGEYLNGNPSDIQAAISNYSISATSHIYQPFIHLEAARKWAVLAQKFSQSDMINAFTVAMNLIYPTVGLDQPICKRYLGLQFQKDISKLSSEAAAAAFSLERSNLALEWLEQSRCIIWNQVNNLRIPLDNRIRSLDPTLANEITRISKALDDAGSRVESHFYDTETEKAIAQDRETEHIKNSQEWDRLLARVRAIPDFEDFLQPPSCSFLLQNLPKSGVVVIISAHEDCCDAIALLHGIDEPLHIPLPKFSQRKAEALRKSLRNHINNFGLTVRETEPNDRGTRLWGDNNGIKGILRELWLLVVQPILQGLGYRDYPPSELSRIWWCPTGSLSFLPIHAAGIYDRSPGSNAISTLGEFAISSYTPTVQVLVDRIKISQQAKCKKGGLFVISQPDTPNQRPIPGTRIEARVIKQLWKNHGLPVLSLESAEATIDKVKTNMENHSCIHLACHASQNTDTPLKSGFFLYDGTLELSAIIQKRLVGADLAYLSACQTSTGDEKLSEEAVHLAAGMLAAGYRSVVATMWSISDKYGPQTAEDFYTSLLEGGDGLNGDRAAKSLHNATQKLRRAIGDSESGLRVWVPYVHFGF